jgi:type II secretory pathway pseudopilin PulG
MLHRLAAARIERGTDAARGETLVEVMVAVAIIAIAGVALIGSVLMSITSSTEHRSLTLNDVFLKSYADAATQQIQRESAPLYNKCASSYAVTAPSDIPPTYSIGISSIQYWSGSNWGASCDTSKDPAQLITVAVTSPTQITTTLSFTVRDPATLKTGA